MFSNDPVKKVSYLSISANIKPYIRISPEQVTLRGMNSEIKTGQVYITGNLEGPLNIEVDSYSLSGKVNYEVETIEEGRKYIVKFENNPDIKGFYRGYLKLKTNYTEEPTIKISVSSRFR